MVLLNFLCLANILSPVCVHAACHMPKITPRCMSERLFARSLHMPPFSSTHAWMSTRYHFTKHPEKVSIGHPCIDAVFQYGFQEPFIARQFLNDILGLKGKERIQDVIFLPRDLPSSDPLGMPKYNFTVDVQCKTKDGHYFLVEMQNDFRDDYHLKALIEHSRMLSRIDVDRVVGEDDKNLPVEKTSKRKFWRGIKGIYSIVLTNKEFGKHNMKDRYTDEPVMEPMLVNPYELRHIHRLDRHYGDTPNQLVLLMLANLQKKPTKALSSVERWACVFRDDALKYGVRKIPKTKEIEDPEKIAGGNKAIEALIDRLDIRHLPRDVKERYVAAIDYHNDSWADIEEKIEARVEKRIEARVEKKIEAKIEKRVKAEESKKARTNAMQMLKDGVTVDKVSEYTGLDLEEVKALIAKC